MKKNIVLLTFLMAALSTICAQGERKFDPERFNNELQQFITCEAALTPQEAAQFFPIYNEYRKKTRVLFGQQRRLRRIKPADEESCRDNIRQRDELEIQMKELQQSYHNQFFKVLPPSKVYDVIKAEDMFHRKMFKKARAK